ncbi:MAG TPA: DUF4157 domain-containing protein [Candidatus Limnocylindrales bacterium]|nr:DUF4157 domain-containing protein [Candidatus Limnocylindrales bacterium]
MFDRVRRPSSPTAVKADASHPAPLGGKVLPAGLRSSMEAAFGHDFGSVRIHDGREAQRATEAAGAAAFTTGEDIVVDGAAPLDSPRSQRLIAHELGHVLQHRRHPHQVQARMSRPGDAAEHEARRLASSALRTGAAPERRRSRARVDAAEAPAQLARQDRDAGVADAGPTPPASAPPAGATATEIAELVKAWLDYQVPGAAAGIGDPDSAYAILRSLDSDKFLAALAELDRLAYLPILESYSGAGRKDPRVEPFFLTVKYRLHDLPDVERAQAPAKMSSLDPGDAAAVRRYLAPLGRHRIEMFMSGPDAEQTRLANLTLDALEAKRKAAEAQAKADADAAAKAAGKAPPATAPTVDLGKVVAKDVDTLKIKPLATDAWKKLPLPTQADWTNKRAPTAIAAVMASIKGTPLETTMTGHSIVFKPLEMLERGGYAYQDGPNLVAGMDFIADAERDPKSVWGILAHEIGGHFEYGTTYASAIADKVLAKLPEADRKRYTQTKEGRTAFYDTYKYSETEIFSALRQRQYDVPVSGPAPVHGAIKPDANIAGRLDTLAAAYPAEVVNAILIELNRRVQASSNILDRDKAYFVAEARKRGYTL